MVLKKTLESYLDSQEIKPVHPQGNQPLDFLGRDDAEAKLHYFGHLMQRTDALEKTLMPRKIVRAGGGGNRGGDGRMAAQTQWT